MGAFKTDEKAAVKLKQTSSFRRFLRKVSLLMPLRITITRIPARQKWSRLAPDPTLHHPLPRECEGASDLDSVWYYPLDPEPLAIRTRAFFRALVTPKQPPSGLGASRLPRSPPATFPSPAHVREHGEPIQEGLEDERSTWFIEWEGVELIVKGGTQIDEGEARITEIARETTGLPIPKVYHVEKDGDATFIYFEKMPGETLDSTFRHIPPAQRRAIFADIKESITRLHQVKAPPSARVGMLGRRPLETLFDDHPVYTAFFSSAEFYAWLRRLYLHAFPDKADEYDREIGSHFDDSAPLVLVHGDLSSRNILVKDGRLSGLIDFGRAGWYPEWVEGWMAGAVYSESLVGLRILQQVMPEATLEGKEWRWMNKAAKGWWRFIREYWEDYWAKQDRLEAQAKEEKEKEGEREKED
ncbi:hypothetical protein JCM10213_004409 [Rhodosporidiobolus nylandii]